MIHSEEICLATDIIVLEKHKMSHLLVEVSESNFMAVSQFGLMKQTDSPLAGTLIENIKQTLYSSL